MKAARKTTKSKQKPKPAKALGFIKASAKCGVREPAFDQACGMEKPIEGIRNFARALCRIAETLDDGDGMIVQELAHTIRARIRELEDSHEYFFRLHHPDRERFEREGWPC